MGYPENDTEFEEVELESFSLQKNGDTILNFKSGGTLWAGKLDFEIKQGDTVRLYPGKWQSVRGIFINGRKVRYETEADYKQNEEITSYGKDAADWLDRWDDGKTVWSIEMGGLGPGYEQAIQITVAEIIRYLLNNKVDIGQMGSEEHWPKIRKTLEDAVFPVISSLGLSGAQWGAAMSVATSIYMRGPIAVMKDHQIKDRHIQVSKGFPSLERTLTHAE